MTKKKSFVAYLSSVFLLIVCLVLTACGGPSDGKKEASQAGKNIEITDVSGQTVTLKKPAERVVVQWSATGGAFLTMAALEGKDVAKTIVGIDPYLQKTRTDMWNQFKKDIPELDKIPQIGSVNDKTFDTEKVISLNPDVIFIPLNMKDQYEADYKPKLDAAGITTIYIDYHAEKLENHQKTIEVIGKALGKEERAKEIKTFYTDHLTKVLDRVKTINKTKPTVYIEAGNEGPEAFGLSYSDKIAWGALATRVGGDLITKDVVKSAEPVNPEFVLDKNPDVILITGSYWPKKASSMRLGYDTDEAHSQELLKAFTTERKGWDTLKAVTNKKVFSAHHGLPREVYDVAVFEYLAKTFYPEEFSDIDPENTLKEFYDKFLPFTYGGIWFMQLK
ncbi:ABC transporter substrate-binding protein [Veillonella sp. VA142]|uniref:ABC transporter substrate-binding protein n=1 Tax=Veillonella sp. VA142 TaxID=741834 RepID=UPI000F8C57B4|nr:ABC transporter substrate-binding protein [Veillonella sp. VA142]